MMHAIGFSQDHRIALAEKGRALGDAAWSLVGLHETDPDLAATAGVEVAALEARGILAAGSIERLGAALEAGHQANAIDIEAVSRLEGLLASSEGRIGACLGTLEAQQVGAPIEKIASYIGLATGAVSLVRSFF